MPTLVSLADYARRRGVSRPAVSKAIAAGRLRESVHRRGTRPVIDPEVADAEWVRNTDTRRVPAERLEDSDVAKKRLEAAAAREAIESAQKAKRAGHEKPEPRQRLVFGDAPDEPVAPPAGRSWRMTPSTISAGTAMPSRSARPARST